MKIYVRRRHIKAGDQDSLVSCPIALAIEDAIGGDPEVGTRDVRIGEEKFVLPRLAQRFISRFDSGKPVKPFAFTIRA